MNDLDIDAMRRYWASPTMLDRAPPGMVEYAERCVNLLADEIERLRAELNAQDRG